MQSKTDAMGFKRKVEEIKGEILAQYANIDESQGKKVRKEQYKQLDEIIEKLDWLIVGHNIGKSKQEGQS